MGTRRMKQSDVQQAALQLSSIVYSYSVDRERIKTMLTVI
jgi:hypothetical protein